MSKTGAVAVQSDGATFRGPLLSLREHCMGRWGLGGPAILIALQNRIFAQFGAKTS